MSSPRDAHPTQGEATFVPAPDGPDVTVLPSGDYSAGELTGERTAPSRGTLQSGGSAHTAMDETRAAPPDCWVPRLGAVRSPVSSPAE